MRNSITSCNDVKIKHPDEQAISEANFNKADFFS